jgi:hypothetical protein
MHAALAYKRSDQILFWLCESVKRVLKLLNMKHLLEAQILYYIIQLQ